MDELFELMNNDSIDDSTSIVDQYEDDDSHTEAEEQRVKTPASSAPRRNKEGRDRGTRKETRRTPQDRSDISMQSSFAQHGTHLAKASIDDRLDIRMTNRLVCSSDLLELIDDYTFFTPAVLSAMTLKRLNGLLQDPSQIIDPATVAGKTDSLVTIGIVFSNSGTRISSKGGAFCVLTIGNLHSGPCLTTFLFGEAYGKYCCSCKPGKVIALMAPKLLPASRGDDSKSSRNQNVDRTVSFSVYDAGQLKIVANARDYGICKASECKHYVDKRNSEYCDFHRRQQTMKGGKQTLNRFQQVKSAHIQARPILIDSTSRKRNLIGTTSNKKTNRFLGKTSASNAPVADATAKATKMASIGNSTSSMGFGSANVPMHMSKKAQNISLPDRKSEKIHRNSTVNPYLKKVAAKRAAATIGDSNVATTGLKRPKKNPVDGNWLENAKVMSKERGPVHIRGRVGFSLSHFTKKQRTANTNSNAATPANRNKETRSINTAGMNFDGSVSIPKPSKIFQQSNTPKEVLTRRIVTPSMESKVRGELLQQQAEVARRMKEGGTRKCEARGTKPSFSKRGVSVSNSKPSSNGRKSENSSDVSAFLAAMGGEIDEEKIRKAKSQFADEVEADEYAKHRRKVVELEKREASQAQRDKKKNSGNGKSNRMTKTWFCQNCRQTFNFEPKSCLTARHVIKIKRELKDTISKDERKNQLQKRSIEDGGLRLGSGIDWNPYGSRMGNFQSHD